VPSQDQFRQPLSAIARDAQSCTPSITGKDNNTRYNTFKATADLSSLLLKRRISARVSLSLQRIKFFARWLPLKRRAARHYYDQGT